MFFFCSRRAFQKILLSDDVKTEAPSSLFHWKHVWSALWHLRFFCITTLSIRGPRLFEPFSFDKHSAWRLLKPIIMKTTTTIKTTTASFRVSLVSALLLLAGSSVPSVDGLVLHRQQHSTSFLLPTILSSTTSHSTTSPSHQHQHQLRPVISMMCQLLGMNSAIPMDFTLHFHGFRQRGGRTDVHSHGWGLAFYDQGRRLRSFHDTQPAATSEMANDLAHHPIHTRNMMAHVRYATQGNVDLANVHPFQRELWGMPWTFCHNGDVPLAKEQMPVLGGTTKSRRPEEDVVYHPHGETDSERIFCAMLNALHARFETLPSRAVLCDALQDLCHEIVQHDPSHTIFNFLLMAGGPNVLWAYSWPGRRGESRVWNGLHYITRQPPFTSVTLRDVDCTTGTKHHAQHHHDKTPLSHHHPASAPQPPSQPQHRVSFIATKPLTYEDDWIEFQKGELIVFDQGVPHHNMGATTAPLLFPLKLQERGLSSLVASVAQVATTIA